MSVRVISGVRTAGPASLMRRSTDNIPAIPARTTTANFRLQQRIRACRFDPARVILIALFSGLTKPAPIEALFVSGTHEAGYTSLGIDRRSVNPLQIQPRQVAFIFSPLLAGLSAPMKKSASTAEPQLRYGPFDRSGSNRYNNRSHLKIRILVLDRPLNLRDAQAAASFPARVGFPSWSIIACGSEPEEYIGISRF